MEDVGPRAQGEPPADLLWMEVSCKVVAGGLGSDLNLFYFLPCSPPTVSYMLYKVC